MRRSIAFLPLLMALLLSPCVLARPDAAVRALVIAVIDGDTLLLKPLDTGETDPRFYKLRLADIDAPEKDQPFGQEAGQELAKLVLHQHIRVVTVATDHYGRRIGWVSLLRPALADFDVNAELVQRGWAWATRYNRYSLLPTAQQDARRAKRGLWASDHPVPPWLWRKQAALHGLGSETNPASASTPLPALLHD